MHNNNNNVGGKCTESESVMIMHTVPVPLLAAHDQMDFTRRHLDQLQWPTRENQPG